MFLRLQKPLTTCSLIQLQSFRSVHSRADCMSQIRSRAPTARMSMRSSPNANATKTGIQRLAATALCSLPPRDRITQPPPPDGGYSCFKTAQGQNVLFRLTTGVSSTKAPLRCKAGAPRHQGRPRHQGQAQRPRRDHRARVL
jgi:hypothetical protein